MARAPAFRTLPRPDSHGPPRSRNAVSVPRPLQPTGGARVSEGASCPPSALTEPTPHAPRLSPGGQTSGAPRGLGALGTRRQPVSWLADDVFASGSGQSTGPVTRRWDGAGDRQGLKGTRKGQSASAVTHCADSSLGGMGCAGTETAPGPSHEPSVILRRRWDTAQRRAVSQHP